MTTATDGAGILAAILAAPDDDLHRLAYADWLDESGDAERAEFVRVQVAVAAWERQPDRPAEPMAAIGWDCARSREIHVMRAFMGDRAPCPCVEHLRARERSLWAKHAQARAGDRGAAGAFSPLEFLWGSLADYRRGFLWRARCDLGRWLEHGPAVVRAHPVTRVETDREPSHHHTEERNEFVWRRDDGLWGGDGGEDAARLPMNLFHALRAQPLSRASSVTMWYANRQDALDSLSGAVILWAKGQS